ncbi:MAG TPA: hypothetical protein VMN36_03130 [Verrucomicrobiales bacterium]|nr:hypothetical protein [Verrucomicrobiales bacterium]
MPRSLRLLAPVLALALFGPGVLSAALEDDLATSYSAWRKAIQDKDFEAWRRATFYARQITTKNLIVSQRQEFPAALFNFPVQFPPLDSLRLLGARRKGDTATAVYFGRVDFGLGVEPVPESLLITRFVFERRAWRFDSSTVMNVDNSPALKRSIESGDLAFLDDPPFAPSGVTPPVPAQCGLPDYVADVHIVALGYRAQVEINGISSHSVEDNVGTEVVIGGLKKGENRIELKLEKLAQSASPEQLLQISVHVKTGDLENPAVQVFRYEPSTAPPTYTAVIRADSTTLGRYAR